MNPIKLSYNLDISEKSSWLTVTAAPSVRGSFAFVQELGDFYCGPDYFTIRENLPSYLINLTLSGGGILEYENASYQIKPGRLFWVDCRKHQHYFTAPGEAHWHTFVSCVLSGEKRKTSILFFTSLSRMTLEPIS